MSTIDSTHSLTGIYARIRGLSTDAMRTHIAQQHQTQQSSSAASTVPAAQPQAAAKQEGVSSRMTPGFLSAELTRLFQEMQARPEQQTVEEEPAADAWLSAYLEGPTADASHGLFHIDENNKVILTDAGKQMLQEVGDIGDYHPKRAVNIRTLTYVHTGEALVGKDLAYVLNKREGHLRLSEINKATAALEQQQQAADKPEPKVAVELDPKWIEAGKKIPVGSNVQKLTENMLTTPDGRQYQEYNPFLYRITSFADVVGEAYTETDEHIADLRKSRINTGYIKQEMAQWNLLDEAKEFFSAYMNQKYGLAMTLDEV